MCRDIIKTDKRFLPAKARQAYLTYGAACRRCCSQQPCLQCRMSLSRRAGLNLKEPEMVRLDTGTRIHISTPCHCFPHCQVRLANAAGIIIRGQAQAAQAALTRLYPKQIGLFPGGCPVVSVCGGRYACLTCQTNMFALLVNSLCHLCCLRLLLHLRSALRSACLSRETSSWWF